MSSQRYPLDWPQGYPRIVYRERPRFKTPNLGAAVQNILEQVRLLKGKYRLDEEEVTISSNVPLRNDGLPRADYMRSGVKDPGVAVYFKHNKDAVVLCCDRWQSVEQNLKAIAITIEDIRRIERNGVSDFIKRSFTGFKALPASTNGRQWWQVLQLPTNGEPIKSVSNIEFVKIQYRELAKLKHPDNPDGSGEAFVELQGAWMEAKKYFGI